MLRECLEDGPPVIILQIILLFLSALTSSGLDSIQLLYFCHDFFVLHFLFFSGTGLLGSLPNAQRCMRSQNSRVLLVFRRSVLFIYPGLGRPSLARVREKTCRSVCSCRRRFRAERGRDQGERRNATTWGPGVPPRAVSARLTCPAHRTRRALAVRRILVFPPSSHFLGFGPVVGRADLPNGYGRDCDLPEARVGKQPFSIPNCLVSPSST